MSDPADASLPRLAATSSGAAVALLSEHHGDDSLIYAASMEAGDQSIGQASRLSDVGASALDAQVAVAPSGGALAVWDRSDGTDWTVQPVTRISGQAWRAP